MTTRKKTAKDHARMISIYTTAYNIERCNLDVEDAFDNFSKIADQVVVACSHSINQNDYKLLSSISSRFPNVNIVDYKIDLTEPDWEGKFKNKSLYETIYPYKIGLDLDERINPKFRPQIIELFERLYESDIDCIVLPTVDLYGSLYTIKDSLKDNHPKFKWYLHKIGLHRGAINGAIKNGKLDADISDSCELLRYDETLCRYAYIWDVNSVKTLDQYLEILKQIPFVFHLGYSDYENRKIRNEWWKEKVLERTGDQRHVNNIKSSFDNIQTTKHKLELWKH